MSQIDSSKLPFFVERLAPGPLRFVNGCEIVAFNPTDRAAIEMGTQHLKMTPDGLQLFQSAELRSKPAFRM
ncbi:MAG TPA: hypothetical protein PKD54_13720 [Pirellulaceae bacterium]|nr:hypothetical protein [Pirellulaceae bacterium]